MVAVAPLQTGDPASLGRYRLEGRLGEGGQGVVFLGRSPAGQPVAVKLLRSEWVADPAARTRFAKEVAAARRVAPFCTARILDAEVDGDTPYVVSEFIDGPSLRQVVQVNGPLSDSALMRLAVGTATALAAIHQVGVVHRDFKPGNVLLGPDGPRVIDFGIARQADATATLTSRVIGTPAYMSPEHLDHDSAIGPPADVFAWAATICYAANGYSPFHADSVPAILHRLSRGDADLGQLTSPLRELVQSCLAPDPTARPSARQLLLRLLGDHEPPTLPDDPKSTILATGTQLARSGPIAPGAAPTPRPPEQPPSPLPQFVGPSAVGSSGQGPSAPWPPYATRGPAQHPLGGQPHGAAPAPPGGQPPGFLPPAGWRPGPPPPRDNWRLRYGAVAAITTVGVLAVVALAIVVPRLRPADPGVRTPTPSTTITSLQPVTSPTTNPTPAPTPSPTTTDIPTVPSGIPPGGGTLIPHPLAGSWVGAANQENPTVVWELRVTMQEGARSASFSMPTLGCSGTLTVIKSWSNSVYFQQDVTTDPNNLCVKRGLMLINGFSDDQLVFSWLDPQVQDRKASGTLRRVG